MASTYSDLKIELIGTGEQVGTWGATTNTNLGTAIEDAITGSADVAFSSADVTLTLTNTNGSQTARNLRLVCTGTSGGARNLILGSGCQINKLYLVQNDLADTVTVKNTTGTGVAIPAGGRRFVFNNGTNVIDAQNYTPVSAGGTGSTTLTANNVILGNGTSPVQFVAPGTNGNVLASNGTTWTSTALPVSFVTGMIVLWSGSIASVPSGWALCNGSNGTPDLRDRFVVGAGSTYAVNATGGSANAITVSHTHTYSGTTASNGAHSHFTFKDVNSSTFGLTYAAKQESSASNDDYNIRSSSNVADIYETSTAGAHNHTYTGTTDSTGTSGTNANLPPYYALAYIMKL
jgi:hypothetical protein